MDKPKKQRADVALVERRISGGADAFGAPAQDEVHVLAVNRCGEQRRIEYGGKVWEIPPESAVWLDAVPDAPVSRKRARWTGRRGE